jgi:hypothetical protein
MVPRTARAQKLPQLYGRSLKVCTLRAERTVEECSIKRNVGDLVAHWADHGLKALRTLMSDLVSGVPVTFRTAIWTGKPIDPQVVDDLDGFAMNEGTIQTLDVWPYRRFNLLEPPPDKFWRGWCKFHLRDEASYWINVEADAVGTELCRFDKACAPAKEGVQDREPFRKGLGRIELFPEVGS